MRNEILFVFLLLHFKNAVMFCDRSTDKGHPYATTVWGSSGVPSSRTEAFSVPPPSPVAVSHSGTPSSKKRADYLAVWKNCVNTHTHTHILNRRPSRVNLPISTEIYKDGNSFFQGVFRPFFVSVQPPVRLWQPAAVPHRRSELVND